MQLAVQLAWESSTRKILRLPLAVKADNAVSDEAGRAADAGKHEVSSARVRNAAPNEKMEKAMALNARGFVRSHIFTPIV